MNNQDRVQKPSKPATNSLKQAEKKKREVFKAVLASPYSRRNLWPAVSVELQNNLVDLLCSILEEIGTFNRLSQAEKNSSGLEKPSISEYVIYGFNSCMKALEEQSKKIQSMKLVLNSDHTLRYLFVCKLDMTTPLLFQHFPILSAYANVKLIQLPKNTHQKLQKVLGLKKPIEVLVLAKGAAKMYPLLAELAEGVEDVDIEFLRSGPFEAKIKHILTQQTVKK
ncbi:hypothetical protein KL935_000199 [Ogataea polymorpha]|nr:hypothetical protein KL935_000199 [Ogataea polymorpha]KAG7908831.1 hypothetical protein KL906_003062 [Ogataea polymorpha]